MLTVQWVVVADYYTLQARANYYTEGGTPLGQWTGEGSQRLGLNGCVVPKDFAGMFLGFGPDGTALIQNAGSEKHQAAWDLTFSDPKSLSLLVTALGPELRQRILALRDQALDFVLDHLQQRAAFTRRGKAGVVLEPVKLVAARFLHHTSRELDPQIHSHVVVMNVGVRDDGTTGTILSRPIYDYKMTAGALYRAQLAYLLEHELGLEIRRKGTEFEVVGIPAELVREKSKRRQAILNRLNAKGVHSARAAATASKLTRPAKVDVPLQKLLTTWQEEYRRHGFGREQAQKLLHRIELRQQAPRIDRLIQQGIRKITQGESHFLARELLAAVAVESQGAGVSAAEVVQEVDRYLAASSEIVTLCHEGHETRYTTKAILEREQRMLKQVEELRSVKRFQLDVLAVARDLQRKLPLTDEMSVDDRKRNLDQRKAAEYLLTAPGAVQVVQGRAGTGKTYLLDVCREVWEKAGFKVTGVSLAGVAARNLQNEAGIPSETLALRIKQLDVDPEEAARRQAWKVVAALLGGKTPQGESFQLDRNSILVVDEAGMVGTNHLARLVEAVLKAGAKLVLVGEHRQLPSIDAGPPLRAIGKLVGEVCLEHITRQRLEPHDPVPTWARDVVNHFAAGEAAEALKLLQERGRLTVAEDREAAVRGLVADWSVEGAKHIEQSLIIAPTREEVAYINRLCQEVRLKQLYGDRRHQTPGVFVGEELVYVGDWVMFRQKSRKYDVDNGERGVVIGHDDAGTLLTVRKSSGKVVVLPLADYDRVELGYAKTIHSSQGTTVDRVYALLGGSMAGRELTYVEASRARLLTRFYTDELEAGPDLGSLIKDLGRERSKALAVEKIPNFRLAPPPEITPPEPKLGFFNYSHSLK